MRISDWSSDVCSSDLNSLQPHRRLDAGEIAGLRREFDCVPPAFLIGGAGRLTRQKGWDVLITAFRGAELPSDARLWLFGSGSAETELHRLARGDSRIRFGGWRKDLQVVYQSNDLFVCPHPFAPLPRELDCGPPAFLIGGAGRLTRKKGWDLLITAFRGAELPSDARLWLCGSGSAEKELHRLARGDSRIRFGGWRKDLKDVYQSLDLFVCPSRFEPLPRVMLEAYDAGVPVISSDAGGCPELVEEYGGDLFPREDVPALTALLERHARERAPRRQVDLSAHHVDSAVAAMLDFYLRVIDHKRTAAHDAR